MLIITDDCINCVACVDECENKAIYNAGEEYYVDDKAYEPVSFEFTFIVPELCNDCKSCIDVCAVEAIEEKAA